MEHTTKRRLIIGLVATVPPIDIVEWRDQLVVGRLQSTQFLCSSLRPFVCCL